MATILIVEDDKTLNDAYKLILENDGHTVITAFDGMEGLEEAQKHNPSIILLDLMMPKMNGIEFLRAYKLKDEHPDVHVVILSNLDMDKEIKEAFELGAYKYILKAATSPKQLGHLVKHLIDANLDKPTMRVAQNNHM